MIVSAQTRILPGGSRFFDVADGAVVNDEGRALVLVNSNGTMKAQFSAGGSNSEIFAGISISHTITPTSLPLHGSAVAVTTTLTLPEIPISGQINLYNVTDGVQLTLGNAANNNEFSVSGRTVTLHADESADTIRYAIRFAPTVTQAIQAYGEGMIGALADREIQGRVGAITKGTVAVTAYLVDAVWTPGAKAYLGANGYFTPTAGSNTQVNAIVVAAPSATAPYLVLELL